MGTSRDCVPLLRGEFLLESGYDGSDAECLAERSADRWRQSLTGTDLQQPTDFTGIYTAWGNFWCDPSTGAFAETDDNTDLTTNAYRAWNLGGADEYPALTCVPGGILSPGH